MPRTILLANEALHLSMRLDSHQVARLNPPSSFPVVPLRGRGDYTRQAPAKERAIAMRQARQVKESRTGQSNFSADYADFS